jgi:hypothetical protein
VETDHGDDARHADDDRLSECRGKETGQSQHHEQSAEKS